MLASSRSGSLFTFCVYFCVFLINWTSGATDYCSISSCSAGQQTMCLYPDSTPSSNCARYNSSGLLTTEESIAILKRHNVLRRKVARGLETQGNPGPQPKASDMKILKWDAELARIAQRYADQCITGHDACRNVEQYTVGQNIATFWSTEVLNETVEELMQGWYDEVALFSNQNVAKYQFESSYGHYSQLVWANTTTVGCGRVLFWDSSRDMNCVRLICNYGPAGNYVGLPVYTIGEPASACSSAVSDKTSSLCN